MKNALPTIKYFLLTMKHKWFVLVAGIQIGAPLWRLIIHDWTKFLPCELPHYGRQFFGTASNPSGFIQCWTHHQNSNPHHWEYWIPRTGHSMGGLFPDNEPIPMPEWAVREMVADWLAAGRAYNGKWPDPMNWEWLIKNIGRMKLHPTTITLLEKVLLDSGYKSTCYFVFKGILYP